MSPFAHIAAAVVVGGPAPELGESVLEREARETEAERWAAALLRALPAAPQVPLGTVEAPSKSWQGGVGELTPPPVVESAQEGSPAEPKGLLLRVNAGDLGELSCWLERGPNGIRVLIGAGGHSAQLALGGEQTALEASLRAAGLPVHSVAVVPLPKFGTVLAQSERTPRGRRPGTADAEPGDTRPGRRIKFFG